MNQNLKHKVTRTGYTTNTSKR